MSYHPISSYAVKSKKPVFPLFNALLLLTSLLPALTSVGVLMGQKFRDLIHRLLVVLFERVLNSLTAGIVPYFL